MGNKEMADVNQNESGDQPEHDTPSFCEGDEKSGTVALTVTELEELGLIDVAQANRIRFYN